MLIFLQIFSISSLVGRHGTDFLVIVFYVGIFDNFISQAGFWLTLVLKEPFLLLIPTLILILVLDPISYPCDIIKMNSSQQIATGHLESTYERLGK